MANNFKPLHRLCGLETEYAIRIPGGATPERTHFHYYEGLIDSLRAQVPLANAALDKSGYFLANGGAVWFEMSSMVDEVGLIEGSTPECRGPRQLLLYQRAQDALFSQAAQVASPASFYLIKNCRDSVGNIYGAQENYEFPVAEGWRLAIWRTGLVLLIPLLPVTWLGLMLFTVIYVVSALLFLIASCLLFLLLVGFVRDREALRKRVLQGQVLANGGLGNAWIERSVTFLVLLICLPLSAGLYLLLWLTAFWTVRRRLTAFLISRGIFSGAGTLDSRGQFHMFEKACGLNCLIGLGGFIRDRPLFSFGHFLKAAVSESLNTKRRYLRLFRQRQRLQIALGDSNMCQTAEYLRIGTTMLLLDMLENDALADAPRLRRPLLALRKIGSDRSLRTTVELTSGERVTALEIQRFYLHAVQEWLSRHPGNEEATAIVRLWEETLDLLERNPEELVGQVDWVTKKHLIDAAGSEVSGAERKKIDLKYHQLGPEGYFAPLEACGACPTLVGEEEIQQAGRTPPAQSPAAARGRFIREFAGERLSVNWDFVLLRRRFRKQVIPLDHYFKTQGHREETAKP